MTYSPQITEAILGDSVSGIIYGDLAAGLAQLAAAAASLEIIRRVGSRSCILWSCSLGGVYIAATGFAADGARAQKMLMLALFMGVRACVQLPGIAVFSLPNTLFPTEVCVCAGRRGEGEREGRVGTRERHGGAGARVREQKRGQKQG